jgi:hypothetical protein
MSALSILPWPTGCTHILADGRLLAGQILLPVDFLGM